MKRKTVGLVALALAAPAVVATIVMAFGAGATRKEDARQGTELVVAAAMIAPRAGQGCDLAIQNRHCTANLNQNQSLPCISATTMFTAQEGVVTGKEVVGNADAKLAAIVPGLELTGLKVGAGQIDGAVPRVDDQLAFENVRSPITANVTCAS